MRPRTLYGWRLSDGRICLSRLPPDCPQLPIHVFDSVAEAHQAAQTAYRKPPVVVWSGSALTEFEQYRKRVA